MSIIIKKTTVAVIIGVVVIVLAIGAIITSVILLGSRSVGPNSNKAAVIGTFPLTFSPTTTTASSGTDFTLSVSAVPTTATAIQGYNLSIIFDNTKVKVKSIDYKVGDPTDGVASTNDTLDQVNADKKITAWGQINSSTGTTLPANASTELIFVTFTSLSSDPSQIALSNTSTTQLSAIQSDGSLGALDAVLNSPLSVNAPVATTAVPVATTAVTETTRVVENTAVPTQIPNTQVVTTTSVTFTSTNTTSTTAPVSTTAVTSTNAVTTVDTTTSGTQTVTTSKPTITGNNPTATYIMINDDTTKYFVSPDASGNWSYKLTKALSNGTYTVSIYDITGAVLGTSTLIVNSTTALPNTGILDEIILPSIISVALVVTGFVIIKMPKSGKRRLG